MSEFLHLLRETMDKGGGVVIAILVLSVILYTRCFSLLIYLVQAHRQIQREQAEHASTIPQLRLLHEDLLDNFNRQRAMLAAMIAAAPLLGLLGTVMGMIATFGHLASREGQKSMVGMASGISEALVATMAGLAVAIPGVLLLYVAHRQLQKCFHLFAQFEQQALEAR